MNWLNCETVKRQYFPPFVKGGRGDYNSLAMMAMVAMCRAGHSDPPEYVAECGDSATRRSALNKPTYIALIFDW